MITNHYTAAYTVATPNYLAYARSMGTSFRAHNPGMNFIICLVGNAKHIPPGFLDEPIICLDELQDKRIAGMLARYTPFEMSTSSKPYFAQHIFETQPELQRLIFLDCDMRIFGPLHPVSDAAIIITPHRTREIFQSPLLKEEDHVTLHRYGVYNTGYFELKRCKEALAFLSWWMSLTAKLGFNQPDKHLFTEQLWIDALPAYFDDYIINKKPGYNVGYWNLIERNVTRSEGQYFVNDEPLVLFHYSHYRPASPDMLVCYAHDYFNFEQFPLLRPLFDEYLQALSNAGHSQVKDLPYPFANLVAAKKSTFWERLRWGN